MKESEALLAQARVGLCQSSQCGALGWGCESPIRDKSSSQRAKASPRVISHPQHREDPICLYCFRDAGKVSEVTYAKVLSSPGKTNGVSPGFHCYMQGPPPGSHRSARSGRRPTTHGLAFPSGPLNASLCNCSFSFRQGFAGFSFSL